MWENVRSCSEQRAEGSGSSAWPPVPRPSPEPSGRGACAVPGLPLGVLPSANRPTGAALSDRRGRTRPDTTGSREDVGPGGVKSEVALVAQVGTGSWDKGPGSLSVPTAMGSGSGAQERTLQATRRPTLTWSSGRPQTGHVLPWVCPGAGAGAATLAGPEGPCRASPSALRLAL